MPPPCSRAGASAARSSPAAAMAGAGASATRSSPPLFPPPASPAAPGARGRDLQPRELRRVPVQQRGLSHGSCLHRQSVHHRSFLRRGGEREQHEDLRRRREGIHFWLTSLLTTQTASRDASSIGVRIGDARVASEAYMCLPMIVEVSLSIGSVHARAFVLP